MEYLNWIKDFMSSQGIAVSLVLFLMYQAHLHLPKFMHNLERIADSTSKHVDIGTVMVKEMSGIREEMLGMKGEMVGMKEHMSNLDAEVGQVKEGLTNLAYEVKHHPPTRLKERA